MLFYINRKYLKSIGELICRKDIRSVRKWCKQNHLHIYKDCTGEFIYENDFDLAYNTPLILRLKAKYGTSWLNYYEAYQKGELLQMLTFTNQIKNEKSNYQPKGIVTSNVLKKR